jgi:hypothetical protein
MPLSLLCLTSAFLAESFTLLLYYPYDTIKWRLQTSNRVYEYKSLVHAFQKEITENGFFSLYKGGTLFLVMFSAWISIQFTIYETYIRFMKARQSENYK